MCNITLYKLCYQYNQGRAVKWKHIISKIEGVQCQSRNIFCITKDVQWKCGTLSVNKRENVSLTFTAPPRLYQKCASILLHTLDCTDNMPRFYCRLSILLIMCLDCTAHPWFYWQCASIVLHTPNFCCTWHTCTPTILLHTLNSAARCLYRLNIVWVWNKIIKNDP